MAVDLIISGTCTSYANIIVHTAYCSALAIKRRTVYTLLANKKQAERKIYGYRHLWVGQNGYSFNIISDG